MPLCKADSRRGIHRGAVIAVDEETHRQVREAGLDAILKRYRDGAMDSEG